MQQLELFPKLDTNPHTVVFTFEGVDYVTEPAGMEVVCDGCAFFDEDWLLITSGCQQSEKVCGCVEHNIIWVKKG